MGTPLGGPLEPVDALSLVARSGAVLLQWARTKGVTYISGNGRELLGWGNREIADRPEFGRHVLAPESAAALDALADDLAETGRPNGRLEVRLFAAQGQDVWFDASLVPLAGADGQVQGFSAVAFEVTAGVEARRAAQDAEERYRRIFDNAPVPLWILDPDTDRILDANGLTGGLYGWRRGEMEDLTLRQLTHPDDWARVAEALHGGPEDGRLVVLSRVRQVRRDGRAFQAEVAFGLIRFGGRKVRLAMASDLSAADEARERLAAKKTAISGGREPIMILDREGRVSVANASCERLLGRAPDELTGQDPAAFAEAPGWADEWRRALDFVRLGEPWSGWMAFKGPRALTVSAQADIEPVAGFDGAVSHVIVRLEVDAVPPEADNDEADLFLQLLRLQVEHLVVGARAHLTSGDPSAVGGALTSLSEAQGRLGLLGDLCSTSAPAWALESGPKARDVNEVLEEALARAKPVLAPRSVPFTRSSRVTGPIAHAALVREAIVELLVAVCAARGGGPGAAPVAMRVEPAEVRGGKGACITLEGPGAADLAEVAKPLRLSSAAFERAGGVLEADVQGADGRLTRLRAYLPFAASQNK